MKDPLLSDVNFRKAVAHAINREDIMAISRNGYAIIPESGSFWGFKTEFKNLDIPLLPYDPDKAREYLSKTNYSGELIEIVSGMPEMIKNAEVIQSNLEVVGINSTVYATDGPGATAYTAWGSDRFQMISFSGAWQFVASSARHFYYPGSAGNRVNYDNPEVAALFDQASVTLDRAERERIYMRIQELIAQDMPYIGLYYSRHVVCALDGVGGMKLSPNMAMNDLSYTFMLKG